MTKPLDELYLTWLYSQIGSVKLKNPARTYWSLAKQLFTKEFVWIVPNDDNRLEDGRDLRPEFIEASALESVDSEWMSLGCSMLEMLVSLSRRLSFEVDIEPRGWFWRLMENLDFEQYTDKNYNKRHEKIIDERLDVVIWRTYKPNGDGGLFPLERPTKDQREIEIWYQLSAYLLEQEDDLTKGG